MSQRPSSSFQLRLCHVLGGAASPALFSIGIAVMAWAFLVGMHPTHAEQRLLAISGNLQPGGSGAQLAGIVAPTLNNSGQVVLQARLAEGIGGVGSHNDVALWVIDGSTRRLAAWKGAGNLADGASFSTFNAASIADNGNVVLRGATDNSKQGLWRVLPDGSMSVIAVTATPGIVAGPQLQHAQYDTLGFPLMHAASDAVVFNSRLKRSVGGVDSSNSRGVWREANGVVEILVRESISQIPETGATQLLSPAAEGVNAHGQAVLLGSMLLGPGGVTADDSLALWRTGGGSDVLIARLGIDNVAGGGGTVFRALSESRINAAGMVAYAGELRQQGTVTEANNLGIWLYDGTANRLIARTGSEAPSTPGGEFESLGAPILSNTGQVLFSAALRPGTGGVSSATARGIWTSDGNSAASLIARSGVGGVPGAPAAKFAEFGALASNDDGLAAFAATLESGAGGVGSGNDQGLWLMDATGDGRLVARTGEIVAGRTITALEFVGGSGGGDGRQRALNDHGQFVYKATFINGDEAALLYTPELGWRNPSGGAWDDAANWTFGIAPSSVHRVELVGAQPTTVIGPTGNVTIRQLQLGGGAGATTLEIPESGLLTVSEGLHLAANGRLAGKGTLAGEVINAGSTSPGLSTGVLAIDGAYVQQAGGKLSIEIGGVDNSSPLHKQFDQLLVFGAATLGGTLDVSLVNGFIPAIGDSFPILKATGGLTAFDAMTLPALPSDRAWAATTSVDTLALTIVATTPSNPADFDKDGDVDAADLAMWSTGYGKPAPGDADGSGWVDGDDFLAWQRAYTGSADASTGVPEPSGAVLAALALLATVRSSARRPVTE